MSLDLSLNEYCIADTIFCLSANPNNKMGGWCYASKETLGRFLSISKQAAHTIINKLIGKGIIEKDLKTKHLRTTQLWYDKVVISRSKETLPVKKLDSDSKETLLQDSKETLPNNNTTNNNKDNTFDEFFKLYPSKRKPNRKGAQRSWNKINPAEHEQIFTALTAYKESDEWKNGLPRFIPHITTWLNGEYWKEPPEPPPKNKEENGGYFMPGVGFIKNQKVERK